MAGPIRISILANASQAKKEIDSVSDKAGGMGGKFAAFGKVAAAGVAVAGVAVAAFAVDAVKSASNAQQSLGATETVFGKFADTVIKTSNDAAKQYGLSANEYRENANLLGALFKNQGVSVEELGGKTQAMIGTASDLAATFGGTTADAVGALGAAFKGEFDSLEKYGISLKASTVESEANALAQEKYGKALKDLSTDQQTAIKNQATSNLIMKQSADAAGAFAGETDTLAHQQQVLGAQWENLKTTVGTALLPVLTRLLTMINDNLGPAFDKVVAAVGPAVQWFRNLFASAGEGSGTLGTLSTFFHEKIVPGVQAVVAAFQAFIAIVLPIIQQIAAVLLEKWGQIQPQVQAIWSSVQSIITNALAIIQGIITVVTGVIQTIWTNFGSKILAYISTTFQNIVNVIQGVITIIQGIFQVFASLFKGDWQGMWDGVKQILSGAWQVIQAVISQAVAIIKVTVSAVWMALKAVTSAVWGGIQSFLSGVWNGIKSAVSSAVNQVKANITATWNGIKSATTAVWNSIKSAVTTVVNGIATTLGTIKAKVLGAFSGAASWLINAGKDIIRGLISGVTNMIGTLKDKFNSITKLIPDWKGPSQVDKMLLWESGQLIMEGLIDGVESKVSAVKAAFNSITSEIAKAVELAYEDYPFEDKANAIAGSQYEWRQWVRANQRIIQPWVDWQENITNALKDQRKALEDMKKAALDYADSVKKMIVSHGKIVGLGVQEDGRVNSTDLVSQLKKKLEDAKKYAILIRNLTAQGLNQSVIQQLLDAGVEGGLATAEGIAAGSKQAIDEINSLTTSLEKVGGSLGNTMSHKFYDAGINSAEGLVVGLENQQRYVNGVVDNFMQQVINTAYAALGIRSPSKVFADIGKNVVLGLVKGMDDPNKVKSAANSLADSLRSGFGTPALDALGSVISSSDNKLKVSLTSEQVSALQRGREIQMDLDAFRSVGGRVRA